MSRAVIILDSVNNRNKALHWIDIAPAGTRVELKKPRRSLPQNDLLWLRLTDIARQLDWYGQRLTPEDWKDIFTVSLRKARVVPGIDPGSYVPLGLRTSDMTKEEFSALLDLIDAFAAEHGVTLSDLQGAA
jgi:hypothetical protein